MKKVWVIALSIALNCCSPSDEQKVTLAVAANLQHAMPGLIKAFEDQHNIKVELASSSSGILTTQIRQGAPFDIFLSADLDHPNILYHDGLANEPKVYAEGELILWTFDTLLNLDSGIHSLLNPTIRKIAIANPATAPYGKAAIQALVSTDLLEEIEPKLIKGESISQVNQYIESMNVNIGMTSKSVLFSSQLTTKGHWIEIPDSLYSPIRQGIVLLSHGHEKNLSNSEQFYKFMFSEKAKEVLTHFGYRISP